MKKILAFVAAALIMGVGAISAKTASDIRIYINPGHGGWCGDCRPMNIIREVNGVCKTITPNSSYTTGVKPDTTAFYESNTNLWKAFGMMDKLKSYGLTRSYGSNSLQNNISLSRIKSGPYPIDTSNKTYNKALSTICSEVNINNYDMFVSIHSNAYDGKSQNYLVFFFAGTTSNVEHNSGSKSMAQKAWPHAYSITHQHWQAVFNNGIGAGVRNDEQVYTSGYGVLNHKVPGYLVEGYFHTYQPSKQRAMQYLADRIEGYMYARGVADYFGLTKESTGDIYGVVRSATEKFTHDLYTPNATDKSTGKACPDVYKPLNGVTVVLKQNGVEKKRMTTDMNYNGVFVFPDLAPGTYTVECSKTGYQTTTSSVTVTAAKSTFPDVAMPLGETNKVKGTPLNNLVQKWNYSEKLGNTTAGGYDAQKIRNFCYQNGKLYCVYDHSEILVLNAQTGAKLYTLKNGDVVTGGTLKLCDVKCIDGKVIACNLAAASNNETLRFYIWENDTEEAKLLKTVTDLRGCARLGDCMEISGSFAGDMYLTFANDNGTTTQIVDFYRKSGSQWGADVYSVLTADSSSRLGTSSTTRAYKRTGGFWIDGFNCFPTWCTVNSSKQAIAQYCLPTNQSWGTGHREFDWGSDHYCANMIFNDKTSSSAENYTGGRARLSVNNVGYTNPITVADYPSAGLSTAAKNGNTTTDCVINTDSKTYVELWVNSTNQGIAYFTYGTPPTHNLDQPSTTPVISASASSLAFDTKISESVSKTLTVSGSNLTADITATLSGANAAMFSIDKATIAKSAASATITVTYNPTAVGTHAATLTLKSTGAANVTVALSGDAKDNTPAPEINDEIKGLTEGWTFSQAANNNSAASWLSLTGSSSVAQTRDIQVIGDNLYVLNSYAYNTTPVINVVDAYTGVLKGTVNTSGVTTNGARVCIGGLSAIDGKLLASSSATASHHFRLYMWNSDSAEPSMVIDDATHGGIVVGDQVSTSGTLANGAVWVTNGQVVLRYAVTNGSFNSTPTVINLSDKPELTSQGSAGVAVESDGSFWVTGSQSTIAHYTAAGELIATFDGFASNPSKSCNQGTSLSIFDLGEHTYLAATTYLGTSNTLMGGAVGLFDITSHSARAGAPAKAAAKISVDPIGYYPANGLGDTRNTQFQTAVVSSVTENGTKVNIFGMTTMQGVTYHTFNASKPTGVNTAKADFNLVVLPGMIQANDPNARIELYSASGALVAVGYGELYTRSLNKGVYIARAVDSNGAVAARKVALSN